MPNEMNHAEIAEQLENMPDYLIPIYTNTIDQSAADERKIANGELVPAPVKCGECVYWKDRKIRISDGTERDYMPNELELVTLDFGINVGSHCTLHGYEDESSSWFWANADDFCSRGRRKGGETQ